MLVENPLSNKVMRLQKLWMSRSPYDYPRWIDTSAMIADPLTKVMNADRMTKTFETGIFDMTPTEESLRIKARNRECRGALRKKTKNKKNTSAEEFEEPDS